MAVNPEEHNNQEADSLERIRGYINSVDESIYAMIGEGESRGMGKADLEEYLPDSIASAYKERGANEEPDEERGTSGESDKKINTDEKTNWVYTFGEFLFEGFQSAGHTSNSMAQLVIARTKQGLENLTDDELKLLLATCVQTRARFAVDAGREKQLRGQKIFDKDRETKIKNQAEKHSPTTRHVMERIIDVCRELQGLELGITDFEKDAANYAAEDDTGDTYSST